jgi:hypothetical protein
MWITQIPEPTSAGLLAIAGGALGLAGASRRKRE